jgi:pyruvate,water dikinase
VIPVDGAMLPAKAGGKALGLAVIARAGLEVPAAWAVLPGVSAGELAALGAELRRRGIARVAVRSSAGDEDGAQHSFAGIHETELGVPTEALAAAAGRVASSPLSERAQVYRRQRGLPAATGPGAVIVQAMVDADWAGVAFGKGGGVLVEAVEGLGEAAVNGDATPEQLELSAEGGRFRVTRRWPRKQPFAVRPTGKGTERVTLEGARPTLPEAVALEVAAGVAALEHALGKPLDVEWAATGGKVAFLQARPQTRPLEAALPPGETFIRTNVRELVPEIVTALSTSIALLPLDGYFREFNRRMGVPVPEGIPLVTVVAGRAVLNERVFFGISDLLGVPRAWQTVIVGGSGEGTNAYREPRLSSVLRHLGLLIRLVRFGAGAEEKARRYLDARRARRGARAAEDPRVLTDEALLTSARRASGAELLEALDHINPVLTSFQQAVSSGAMALKAHPAPAALLARLLDPELVSVSTRQVEEQVELARDLRGWEGASRFLVAVGPEHAAREHWRRSLPPELWTRVEAWLEAYGHRGPYESELALPRVKEDLRLLATALRPLVLGGDPPESSEVRRARRRADAEAAWREVEERCGRFARVRVRGTVRELGRFMLLREELRSEWMRDWELVRRDLLELGRRAVERGRLDAVDDLFHLTSDEAERALRDPAFDARSAVARERARIGAWRRIEVPNRFTGGEVASFQRGGATAAGDETVLRGTAVSPGEVEGRACVLRSPDDEAKMGRGGILVAPATNPGWAPLFARAAGVVVELGGVMSHAATVAREYGLPCVSNVDGAVAKLRDGDLVRVDGTHGTVEILERA